MHGYLAIDFFPSSLALTVRRLIPVEMVFYQLPKIRPDMLRCLLNLFRRKSHDFVKITKGLPLLSCIGYMKSENTTSWPTVRQDEHHLWVLSAWHWCGRSWQIWSSSKMLDVVDIRTGLTYISNKKSRQHILSVSMFVEVQVMWSLTKLPRLRKVSTMPDAHRIDAAMQRNSSLGRPCKYRYLEIPPISYQFQFPLL